MGPAQGDSAVTRLWLQAIAYSNETREVATCGTGPKIEVWATKPMCVAYEGILLDAPAVHRLTLQGHSADVTHVGLWTC